MRNRMLKKVAAVTLSVAMAFSMVGCGSGGQKKDGKKNEALGVTIEQINLGEDYKDIKADLKFVTNRTDLIDTTFKKYVEEFQKDYPNVNIEYCYDFAESGI